MMRVAYVCTDPGIPVWGTKGASIHVQEMLRAFIGLGAEVTVLSPRLEGAAPQELSTVATVTLSNLTKGDTVDRARQALNSNDLLRSRLHALGHLDLVYERHALYAHAAMEFARDRGTPSVLEVNAPLLIEQARHRALALPDDAEASVRRTVQAAAIVTAVSPAVAEHALDMGARQVHVVPNAVTPCRFPLRPPPEGPFTLGFVGSLKPWHDVATVLPALSLLRTGPVPEARLLIVGDGPERGRLEAEAARLGLASAVEFTGAVPPDAVPEALARMHVGLAPYAEATDFYFSPLKLYEYLAAGLPVVASRVGHLAEVVDHGRTGLLTPPRDPRALALALARLAAEPATRAALGAAARAEVLAHHTWDGVAARVLSLAGLQPRLAA